MRPILLPLFISAVITLCFYTYVVAEPVKQVVLASEIDWQQLNPARGDKSPQAGTLWGDRRGPVPTGFLAKFVDGFSSPPHIHNVTYRAVVISGTIHNDDPDAANMWMAPGSFWTQPKGEAHITSAKGDTNIALVEIDRGPYLVLPVNKAFDSGERPVNVDASNIVWVDPSGVSGSPGGPKIAYLWGSLQEGQANGTFVKLPAGFDGKIVSSGSLFRAVVIKGAPRYQVSEKEFQRLEAGSYFSSKGVSADHSLTTAGEESVIYIRTNGRYQIIPQ
ncbi:MAG: DUF4437 domain-containing protein [Candidatus Thiodiazotropha taylori]